MEGLVCLALSIFWLLLLARVVLSWLELAGLRRPVDGPMRSAYDLLMGATEPVLRPLRRIVPPAGMFDLSIVVAFVIIFVLQLAIC
ncbi:MAG: hypothetical protein KatS3mg013_0555 [Actinomycetota bacterium]|nr:MAG: hypothetical protein KatS3mg013_0555 [Actinomycetota bacterium]